jgi:uncharacterized membrane protein YgdD (TMEM256/DUF423 family)
MRQPVSLTLALIAGLAGATGVLCGAFGAHALSATLDARAMAVWHTAVQYHLWHALALVLACVAGAGRARLAALWLFPVGIVLFSGSLYALALGAPRLTGVITPFGGLAFIAGWVCLGLSLRREG